MIRISFLLVLSFFVLSDHHKLSTKYSECQGKVANYYVAEITDEGSVKGWYKAAKMHQKYYADRNAKVKVYPSMQYRVDEENNTVDELFRVSTTVVWESQEAWNDFRDYLNNRSEAQAALDDEEYQAFVSLYDKNNEVTARRRLCML